MYRYSVFSVFSAFRAFNYLIYSNLIEFLIEFTGVILVYSGVFRFCIASQSASPRRGVQLRDAVLLDWVGLIGMVQIWQALPQTCRGCLK